MSWPRRTKGQTAEQSMGQQRCGYRRSSRSILRLNSTGDVTTGSDSIKSNCSQFVCPKSKQTTETNPVKANTTVDGDPYLKKLVGNLNMCSIIDSASMYIESAANYIESWAPKETVSNNFNSSNSGTNTCQSLGFIKSIFTCDNTKMTTTVMDNTVNGLTVGQSFDNNMNIGPTKPTWSCSNILGAFHTTGFLGNYCTSRHTPKMSVPKVDPYVPPQRRKLMEDSKRYGVCVDPKLTPYNAKLLEKSKKGHTQCDNQSLNGNETASIKQSELSSSDSEVNSEIDVKIKEGKPQTEVETEDSVSQMDWFEYDSLDSTIVPITISEEKLESCLKNETETQQVPQSPETPKPLHNWFSVEFDSDVHKRGSNSQTSSSSQLKESVQKEIETEKPCDTKQRETDTHEESNKEVKTHGPKKSCMKSKHNFGHTDHAKHVENISAVLYERSGGKKSRPSKKKRTRQKAQTEQGNQNVFLKPGSAVHSRSPVAFILGVNKNSSENLHSFQMCCDFDSAEFDSDSDFSTDDSDDNFSSLDDDEILGLRCNNPLGAFGVFTVSCSITPTPATATPASPSSKEIEAINQHWQFHISIESHEQHSSVKKVISKFV